MIPGQVTPAEGSIALNKGRAVTVLTVANTGDRPVQVGSHYHFSEANPALVFDRVAAHGQRLAVAAGTSVRFEPGIERNVELVPFVGARWAAGFRGEVAGPLDPPAGADGGGDSQGAPGGAGGGGEVSDG